MEQNEFELVLQVISTGLVAKIIAKTKLNEDIIIEKLYSSKLYSTLEEETTKVWHYSIPMLYELWEEEQRTGQLVLPEY